MSERPKLVSEELSDPDRVDDGTLELGRQAISSMEGLQRLADQFSEIERQAGKLDLSLLKPDIASLLPELRIACVKAVSQLQGLMTIAAVAKLVSSLAQESAGGEG